MVEVLSSKAGRTTSNKICVGFTATHHPSDRTIDGEERGVPAYLPTKY